MRKGNQLVRGGEHRLGRVEVDPAVLGQRAHIDRNAPADAVQLPWNDVGVVFELRQQDAVARLELRHAPGRGDEVDRLGRAAREHDFALLPADEAGNLAPRGFVRQRHFGRAGVNAPMHRGVIAAHRVDGRLDHGARFLRGGGSIEVVPAVPVGLDQAGPFEFADHDQSVHSKASSADSAASFSASSSAAPTKASAMNACNIRALACAGGNPREAR